MANSRVMRSINHSGGPIITEHKAQEFAEHWIQSWNRHDIEAILSHYAEDVEYFSPFLTRLADNSCGTLRGKWALKAYLAKGLAAYPDLDFVLKNVFFGVHSVVIQYQSVNNLNASEVFEFDENGLVRRVQCHYDKW